MMMAEEERQIRTAAETLLTGSMGSINSQRGSYSQQYIARTPDIIISEDLIAGARYHGQMSNVRRFFCLLVTFDLAFTCLMWIICFVIAGDDLKTAFIEEVEHYTVRTSLFDIVMAAICRFTILLLFYALLYMNHWIIVALSTTATCGFLIAKVFFYDWKSSTQPVYEVLLVLASFILAWAEAWHFDFRVIPQETQARNWYRTSADAERSPLLEGVASDARQYSSMDHVGTFFTPMDSPAHSDIEEDGPRRVESARRLSKTGELLVPKPLPKLTPEKTDEYKKKAASLLKNSHELLTSADWKVVSTTVDGDVISSMHLTKPGRKIWKITGVVDAPAPALCNWLYDKIEETTTWNKNIAESVRLQRIDDNADIVYQATNAYGGGMVGARDFIILRSRGKCGSYFISSGVSVPLSAVPPRKHYIRGENGVGCWATSDTPDGESGRCFLTWVLNTNLKGWIPQKLVEVTFSSVMTEYMNHLRKHLRDNPKSWD